MNADDRERRREERRRRRQMDEAEESSTQAEASAAPTVDPDEERRLARERRRKEREAANAAAEEESRKMQEELEARRMRRRKMRDGMDENQDDSDRVLSQKKLEEEAKKKEEEEARRREEEEERRKEEEERKRKEEEKRQREEEERRQREEEEEEEERRREEEEEKRRQEEEEELRREEEEEKERREMEARRKKAEMRKREEEARKAEQPKVKQAEQPMVKGRSSSPAEDMGDENSGPPPEKTQEKSALSSFKSKLSAGRKLNIKTLMLKKAKEDLAQEAAERESAKRKYLEDVLPPLKLGGLSKDALESLCRDLHAQIEQAEEERFEAEYKVKKNDQEIEDLNMRIMSFTGRFKKPELKKVKVTPENMLNSLAESRRTKPGIIDFRANLKHVEREGHDSRRGSSSTTKSEGMEENLNGEED